MDSVYIIAEVAQAHDGSLGILHSYIDALAETGVDAVKFQTHIAEAESSEYEPFRVPFSYEDKTRFDYWKRMSFTEEQWVGIQKHCREKKVDFIASPFSIAAVDLLARVGVDGYKIGSGEVTNHLLLEKVGAHRKPVILSSGMSDLTELREAIEIITEHHDQLTILQCTTAYPTPPERVGLNMIQELKQSFPSYKIGISEHTALIETGIAAVALGAETVEYHVTFDRRKFGPDAASSLTIDEVVKSVNAIRNVEKMVNNPIAKNDLSPYTELKNIFEKSLAVNKKLSKDHILTRDDLETKKPSGRGYPASKYKELIGKKLNRNLKQYEFLNETDVS